MRRLPKVLAPAYNSIYENQDSHAGPSAEIWQRVVEFQGEVAPSAARALLKIAFS